MDADTFLRTLREELLDPHEYSDVSGISSRLSLLQGGIECLERLGEDEDHAEFFECSGSYELAGLLLGTPPQWLRARPKSSIAPQLSRWRQWLHGVSLKGAVVGLLLAEAQRSRAQRRRRKFTELVSNGLGTWLHRSSRSFSLRTTTRLKVGAAARTFDYVVEDDGGPLVAVVDIFQTRAGGRQQDMFLGLPDLQASLAAEGIVLLVIADGPGFRSMAQIVRRVAPQLEHFTNLKAIDEGDEIELALRRATALREGLPSPGVRGRDEALSRVTTLALRSGRPVTPPLLGISESEAEAFLLRYEAAHPHYALPPQEGARLEAEAAAEIRHVNRIFRATSSDVHADQAQIVETLSAWLGYVVDEYPAVSGLRLFGLRTPGLRLRLPDPLPVFTLVLPSTHSRSELFEAVDTALSRGELIARLAVLIDPVDPSASRMVADSFASQKRSQIAVLDQTDTVEILLRERNAARQYLATVILRDVDLSLVSPFVSEGPTPHDMFFGREAEIRRIGEQIQRQSFALVGGRKVGKTSMLQRLRSILAERLPVFYVDCQAHPDREDFLNYLNSLTEPRLRAEGVPAVQEAESVIRSFLGSHFGRDSGVLLLDEVDELFYSDSHSDSYPHVLSRALRSISQSSTASLVATGERSLFSLTKDPTSPHWNFCTPLRIGPLSADAGRSLLQEPLRVLGIDVTEEGLDLAVLRTALHPNLLQYLGNQIVDLLSPLGRMGGQLSVGAAQMETLTGSPDFRNRFILTFWSQATPLEKLISIELHSERPRSLEILQAALLENGVRVRPSDITSALEYLELYSVARQSPEGYLFASKAFDLYLSPLISTAIADQWREELRERLG